MGKLTAASLVAVGILVVGGMIYLARPEQAPATDLATVSRGSREAAAAHQGTVPDQPPTPMPPSGNAEAPSIVGSAQDERWFIVATKFDRCVSAEEALGAATPEAAAEQFARDGAPMIMVQRTEMKAIFAKDMAMNGAMAFIKGEVACETAMAMMGAPQYGG